MDLSGIASAAALRNSKTTTPSPENPGTGSSPGTPVVSNKPPGGGPTPPPLQGDDSNKLAAIMAKQRQAAEEEAEQASVDEYTIEEVEEVEEVVEEVEEVVEEIEETEETMEEQGDVEERAPAGDASADTEPQGGARGGLSPEDDSNSSGSIERFDKATAVASGSVAGSGKGSPTPPPQQQQGVMGGPSPQQQQQQQQRMSQQGQPQQQQRMSQQGQQQQQQQQQRMSQGGQQQPPPLMQRSMQQQQQQQPDQSQRTQPYVAASPVDMQVNLDSELESEHIEETQTEDQTENEMDMDEEPQEGEYDDNAGYGAANGQADPYDQNAAAGYSQYNQNDPNQQQGSQYGQQPNNGYDQYGQPTDGYDEYGDNQRAMGADEFLDEPQGDDLEQQRLMEEDERKRLEQQNSRDVNYGAYGEPPPPVDPKELERRREANETEINCLFFVLVISCFVLIFAIGGVGTILALWLKDNNDDTDDRDVTTPTFAPNSSPTVPTPTVPTPTGPPSPTSPTVSTTAPSPGGPLASTFSLDETLTSDRTASGFSSVAYKDGFLVLGEQNFGANKQGQALTFFRSATGGKFQALAPITATSNSSELFGNAIDLAVVNDVPTVLIGAESSRGALTSLVRFGAAAYLEYNSDSNKWDVVGGLIRGNEGLTEAGADFGGAVALASTIKRVVVAAPSSSKDTSNLDTGKVYTYGYNGQAWTSATAAPYLEGEAKDFLGTSIDLTDDGSKLIVGAPGDGTTAGYVNYYDWGGTDWTLSSTVSGTDNEALGSNVEFIQSDGSRFAASGPQYQNGQGVVIAYIRTNTNPVSFTPLGNAILGDSGEELGRAVAGNNGLIAVGTNKTFRVFEYDSVSDTWLELGNTPADLGSPVKDIAMSEDGKYVLVGLESGLVQTYQLSS